ncbi:hypothetical protein [Xanthobacter dioxanivorans]|uniref:hypothetical protein n=1 Tax=Xanthobacter dioxanivorans TaxID=2528964 RepID=UPI001AED774A|nr:hypothetical protein [Xanthobacter dioxanivorans]
MEAGYWSEDNAALETADCEYLIATTKDWKQRKAMRAAPPPRGRMPGNLSTRERMDRKLLTKRGRALYRLRGQTVEPVFGQMKGDPGRGRLRDAGRRGGPGRMEPPLRRAQPQETALGVRPPGQEEREMAAQLSPGAGKDGREPPPPLAGRFKPKPEAIRQQALRTTE